ncbi:MAG: tRNA (adenosine(37)-N6)-threonylcarbamoyltransferase complex transferase subunit TsaD [Flavobacteriales bacterium]|jgi:N6-L-threonylcarbamoyladenine synthase|nr:tRNA (adenosine(37)-N6)-threonylcarbamoyltransferase complex transferase subunit TsaD [Flavobacteriales bacterium]
MNKPIIILAIETSCDDTSVSIIKDRKILSNIVANQAVHEKYGGVVPELASRAHMQNMVPVLQEAMNEANLPLEEIDAIAYTKGPGLMGSLLVGSSIAQGLAFALEKPLIGVHHMQGHILAHFIEDERVKNSPEFPFICLTISGGHTQLIQVNAVDDMHILGETIDDAVGEAFDKTARYLDLPYPGGPVIDRLAKKGNPRFMKFTKPKVGALEFSFSGLKTNIIQNIEKEVKKDPDFVKKHLEDICASVQFTIVGILLEKLHTAVKETGINRIAIAGGVSANSAIRKELLKREKTAGWDVFMPSFEYCTDNAGMIAITAHFQYLKQDFVDYKTGAKARLENRI